MPYLSFVSDAVIKQAVSQLITIAKEAQEHAIKNFGRNVIDPFGFLFEMSGFQVDDEQNWIDSERRRQAQKTLQNHVGAFHQKILGSIASWEDLNTGSVVDLVSTEKQVIAEIKNKYNTVKGSDKVKVYDQLELAVMTKGHRYRGFTGYYVEVLPKTKGRYDKEFIPSDNNKSQKRQANPLIRQIDGYSFYALTTGIPDALEQLFKVLPNVIEDVSGYKFSNSELGNELFTKAYFKTTKSKK